MYPGRNFPPRRQNRRENVNESIRAREVRAVFPDGTTEVMPTTSKLVGFDVGDEGVIDALTIPEVGDRGVLAEGGRDLRGKYSDAKGVAAGAVQCIGCHTSTPDGTAVAFTDHWPWDAVLASIEENKAGQDPAFLTPGAQRLLNQPWLGMDTFSMSHFAPGDRILVTSYAPPDAPTLTALYDLRSSFSLRALEIAFLAGAAGAIMVFALVPRRALAVLPALLAAALAAASVAAATHARQQSEALRNGLLGPDRRWMVIPRYPGLTSSTSAQAIRNVVQGLTTSRPRSLASIRGWIPKR